VVGAHFRILAIDHHVLEVASICFRSVVGCSRRRRGRARETSLRDGGRPRACRAKSRSGRRSIPKSDHRHIQVVPRLDFEPSRRYRCGRQSPRFLFLDPLRIMSSRMASALLSHWASTALHPRCRRRTASRALLPGVAERGSAAVEPLSERMSNAAKRMLSRSAMLAGRPARLTMSGRGCGGRRGDIQLAGDHRLAHAGFGEQAGRFISSGRPERTVPPGLIVNASPCGRRGR